MSFKSFMEHIGHDIKIGLEFILPWAEGVGQAAVDMFAPGLGQLFKQTVAAVATAEQSAVAVAAAGGSMTGPQKLSAVIGLLGPLIEQSLKDAGKDSSAASVANYINSVVSILNLAPAPVAK